MKWISPSIFLGLSFALHQFRHPSFPVSLTPAGVVSATAAGGSAGGAKTTEGTKGTWGPWGPRAPKGTAGTYGAGKIGKGWDLCGFDMLDISCRNMFWGLADFKWLWVDPLFGILLFPMQSFGCPNVRKGPEILKYKLERAYGWDKTAKKTMQDRFFCLPYCCLKSIPIHRSMKMEWNSPSIFHGLSFALHQFRHPSFPVSLTPASVVSATAAGGSAGGAKTTEGTKGTWGPWAPKGTAGTYGAGKIGKGWDLCGFDMLDISCRNMFWGLADFKWMWVDPLFGICCFLCSPLGANMSEKDLKYKLERAYGWDKTAKKTMQDRFFCLPYCCLKSIPIHRSMKMEWSGFPPPSFMVCLLRFINSGTLRFPFHWLLLALWAPLLQVEVPEAPKPPKAPKAPEVPELPKAPPGTYGAGKIGKGWDLCGFDMLDISCRNMFWGMADFIGQGVDSIVWYFVVSCAVLWVPKCQKRTWNISLKGHMAETRLQRKQCRIVSSVFPIVASNPSQSIDPWKWNEVDFPLHLSWSVFCSSSIQAPFVSRFIDSCWRCKRHCCRHQRHLRSLRSQSSQRHRRDLWVREDREGVGPVWLWHAWYLLQEHVLRSGGFQMTGGRLHCLVFCCFLCSPLGAQMSEKDLKYKLERAYGWDKTAKKTMQDRFFCLPYCCLKSIPIHRSMKMEWNSPSIFHGLSFALHQFRHPSFLVSLTPAGVVSATAAGGSAGGAKTTEGTWGPWGPRAPKGTAGTYGAGKIGKGWDLCGFTSAGTCFEVWRISDDGG